jgi:hypothetical protein
VLDRSGGGVARVVPALEGDDHQGVGQLGQVVGRGRRVDHLCEPTSVSS